MVDEAKEALAAALGCIDGWGNPSYDSTAVLEHLRERGFDVTRRAPDSGAEERRTLFEAGRATGTVEGWADYTETRHDDEYDALARQFHESIAEGQSVADTAKALRILADPGAEKRLRAALEAECDERYHRTIARIHRRAGLFRLGFDDRRATRTILRSQAEEFETWLTTLSHPFLSGGSERSGE